MPRPPAPNPTNFRKSILQYIADHPDRPLRARALARALGVADEDYAAYREAVRDLLDEGGLALGRGRTLTIPEQRGGSVGVFHATRHGYGFVELTGRPDLYIPAHATAHALDGDTVQVRLLRPDQRGAEPRGEVVKIVARARIRWIGVLQRFQQRWFIQPQGKTPLPNVAIDDPSARGAIEGDLVCVEPLVETLGGPRVRGVIVARLGDPDATTARIRAAIHEHDIADEFPAAVLDAAQQAAARPIETADRLDLRAQLCVTIDPRDARDFDDAISIEHKPGGRTELSVHIADVAAFVDADGPIDLEARERGTSVYFPGYVVPMLPEMLSNGVCSLQPNQPRLTKSVFITYDRDARIVDVRIARSLIQSRARLTYDQVTAVLAKEEKSLDPEIVLMLFAAERLAARIRKRRLADGMISLTIPEVEIVLDARRNVADARPADTSFSHTLIEMFMVEANEAVCRYLDRRDFPVIRRIHPEPSPEAADRFTRLALSIGQPLGGTFERSTILRLLKVVDGQPAEPAVHYLLLRCLSQAAYSTAREGHFALASEHYCHFTSPIRRYPDLIVHRQLDAALVREATAAIRRYEGDEAAAIALHCSHRERRAAEAERDLKNDLLVQFMRDKIGREFEAIVTGVVSVGAFVQIRRHLAEGLIPKSDFGRERWEFDSDSSRFVAARTGRVLTIGTRLKVIVTGVDEIRREIQFAPAGGAITGNIIHEGNLRPKPNKRPATRKRPPRRGRR